MRSRQLMHSHPGTFITMRHEPSPLPSREIRLSDKVPRESG